MPVATPTPQDPSWTAEEARQLLEAKPEGSRPSRVVPLGRGWDADVFLVDEAWVLRLPRNQDAAKAFERELQVSAWLAAKLPLEIPQPRPELAHSCGIADWRFVLSPLLAGKTITDAKLGRKQRAALARPLGEFVAALHEIDPQSAPIRIEADPYDRFDAAARLPKVLHSLDLLAKSQTLAAGDLAKLRQLIEPGPPPLTRPTQHHLVHADLHRRNLLVDENGKLSGVIDWVDLHLGEKAADLATIFSVLPPEAHAGFLATYGEVTPEELGRARWRAAVHMTLALQGSLERGDALFAESCRSALLEMIERY